MDFINQLNDNQRLAVQHKDGPLMIVAGAGSGKTRVLTYRIAHLIREGVDPFNILALTFTNKAAKEMRERIERVVGPEAKSVWMGTFHSVFARILRAEAEKLGYPRDFTIYDTDDSKSLIKSIVKEEQLDPKIYKPGIIFNRISSLKNQFIFPKDYAENPELQEKDAMNSRPKMGEIYRQYVSRCFKAQAMDFDDLLIKTYQLFKNHLDALNKYQHKFRYILVDEYQDTNYVQYLIIKKLAAAHQNICVVGDDAQSIYAFRGADIQNILDFEKDYPDLAVYKLEQNYRSTQNIVKASGAIIEQNKFQLKKELWTQNVEGEKISVFKAANDKEESAYVANQIIQSMMTSGYNYKDFAVLYRTNAQSRPFEEAFRKKDLKYRIIGGTSFYQRKEIKDMLAYFRLCLNLKDEEALKRIINFPTRGISKATQDRLALLAKENDLSMWEVMEKVGQFGVFNTRVCNAVENFVVKIKNFHLSVDDVVAYDLAMDIAKSVGILQKFHEDRTEEGIMRYENVQQLLSGLKEFSESEEVESPSLGNYMQQVSLMTSLDEDDDDDNKISVMTIHAAKGLEFPVVFIVGLEENLFPSQMALNSREELEEERRLFYVAITRAEQKAHLTYAESRYRWGTPIFCESSRFIDEIDSVFLNYHIAKNQSKKTFEKGKGSWSRSSTKQQPPKKPQPNVIKKPVPPPTKDFTADSPDVFEEGMRIEHNRFGKGSIALIDGKAPNQKATVDFDAFGEKQILLRFAKMKKLS